MASVRDWPRQPVGNKNYSEAAVVVIGAGISGICTAINLIRSNIHNFIIFEKSGGPGGTWRDNRYPGCACDVFSHLYSFSFEQNPDWTRLYPGQEEILRYIIGVTEKYDLYKYIRFNTSVDETRWDDAEKKWKTTVKVAGSKDAEFGDRYAVTSDFLVSAVGQLNQPQRPDIPGLEDFKGKAMHSARWDWNYDFSDKRIAIVGNGATAAQIIPEVSKEASHLTVFQRTPNWVIPRMDTAISQPFRALFKYVPPARWRLRADMMDFRETFYAMTDPESDFSKMLAKMCVDMMKNQLPDPEMWEKLTPNYPPGCKRVIISDEYFSALARSNVNLETKHIERFTDKGVRLEGGDEQEFDLIILATGFRTVEFMHPIKVTGSGGRSLSAIWKGGARALYGVTVESLPNFGMLYGPNTNLSHNSIILMIESQARYIHALVSAVLRAKSQGKSLTVMPKPERVDRFNADIQDVLKSASFAHPNCMSWYKRDDGLITNNWSGTVIEYQELVSKVCWDDFNLSGNGAEDLNSNKRLGRVVEETYVSYKTLGLTAVSFLAIVGSLAVRSSRWLPRLK